MADNFKTGRPPKGPEKVVKYGSSLPADLYERPENYCNDNDRPLAYPIRKALEMWLKKQGY